MGYAKILGGGEDGRYTIELDYGAATKAATLAALTELLAKIDTGIAEQQALNAIADAVEAEQRAKVLEAQQQVIDQTVGGLPPGGPKPDTTLYKFELLKLSKLQQKHAPMRLNLQALLFDRQQALKQVAKWNAFTPTETRQAWCADLTEDAPAGSYAATLEIPGESSLVLLAPGCRAWMPGDGTVRPAVRLEALQKYGSQVTSLQNSITKAVEDLTAAVEQTAPLNATLKSAQSVYQSSQSPENKAAVSKAQKSIADNNKKILGLRAWH